MQALRRSIGDDAGHPIIYNQRATTVVVIDAALRVAPENQFSTDCNRPGATVGQVRRTGLGSSFRCRRRRPRSRYPRCGTSCRIS